MAGRAGSGIALGLVAATVLAGAGAAQREEVAVPESEAPPAEPQAVWYVDSEESEIADLLDLCAAFFELPLEYDRSQVTGRVTIRTGAGITNEAFWTLTNRLLAERSLACIQGAGEDSLGIVPIAQAAKLARVEAGPLEEARAGYVKVLRTLRQAEAETVAELLRHVLTTEGSLVQPLAPSGQVLLAGLKPQVLEAIEVLELVDVPFRSVVVEEVPVRHLPPTAIVSLLERVGQALGQVGQPPLGGVVLADPNSDTVIVVAPEEEVPYWRDAVTRFDRPQGTVVREYRPERFGLGETARLIEEVVRGPQVAGETPDGWRLVQDDLTGTLVLTATLPQHEEVKALLARLEGTPRDAHKTMRAYAIRHRDVDELLELLGGLIEGGAPLPPGEERDEGGGGGEVRLAGAPVAPVPASGPVPRRPPAVDVALAKDEGTNRILAVGPPRVLDELGRLIETLDVQHSQVLVETMIVNLSESQTRDLAVELSKLTGADTTLMRFASLFGAGSPDPSSGSLPPPGGSGLESVILDPGSFSGIVRALETVNEGRSLTIPKVLVNNNETANLDSVLQTPFASTNASTTVATTSFGGTQDAGTVVSVTPQITEGDQLLVEYTVSLSSFVGDSADPTLPPPRQENRLASVATLPDGYAVVVGGLEVETEVDADSRVPILGSIPLFGNLFKSTSTSTTKTRFFVFLRCSILRHARFEDLRFVSGGDLRLAGLRDDWPVVEPRLIR